MISQTPLVIYGAGGLGSELLPMLIRSGKTVHGFIDDGKPSGTLVSGFPVLGGADWLLKNHVQIILAFGDPQLKRQVHKQITTISGVGLVESIADPQSVILDPTQVKMDEGSILTAGVILTTRINIGKAVLINLNTTIGHDTVIGDFTSIMPGCNIAGHVRIGNGVLIGSGANILGGISVGDGAVVGSGAVVTRDVAPGKTMVGIPAREMNWTETNLGKGPTTET